jgi:DUF4097 and DUF4098 domain-containing protein YvlB
MIQKLCLSTLLLSALMTFAEQDVIHKQFDVKPGGTLFMDVDRGSVKILTSKSDKMEIEVLRELKRASAEQAREAFEKHQINFTQEGDTIRIESEKRGLNPFKNIFNNYRVEYTITVPTKFNLDLNTAGGSISSEDLDGKIKARTTGGSLDIGSVSGEIQARTSGGSIKVKACESKVEASTTGGNINIGRVKGEVTARTSGGSITLAETEGSVDANTTGGNIKIASTRGPLKATTTGGSVLAELSEQASGECTLKTTGGGIKVTLPEKIAADLEASTTGGRVNSDFDGEFNKQRTKLVAKLNGGGPQMRVQTSGGSIDIRRK